MEILSLSQVQEWTNVEADIDVTTLTMLESAGIDHVEHLCNRPVRAYIDPITNLLVTPDVPMGIVHAISLFISANYDNRLAPDPACMTAIQRLCAPFRRMTI